MVSSFNIQHACCRQILEGDSGELGDDNYADGAYDILDRLFSSVESWQEVPVDEDRYRTSSSLLRQLDLAGEVALSELSARNGGGGPCDSGVIGEE